MSDEDSIRRAISQAFLNYRCSNVLACEVALVSVCLALHFKSWWVLGGVFVGFFVILEIPYLGFGVVFLLSLVWGVIGWEIGGMFHPLGARFVLGLIGFVIGLGTHLSGWQWLKDQR